MGFSTAMSAVGAGMQAGGAMSAAEAQKQGLQYQAQVAGNNAIIAGWQAQIAKEVGAQREQAQRLNTSAMMGSQRAHLAASGVDLGEGSANEVLTTTKHMGEIDALTIRDNAAREAWAHQNQAAGFRSDQAASLSSASNINPLMAGATSLMGSAKSFGFGR